VAVKIGRLASESGVSIDTIRFYERRGVLPAAPRTASGYRIYTDSSVTRIRRARRLQSLGLTLEEVIGALRARDQGHASCETQRWRLQAALGRIDVQIAELARLRGDLRDALAACEAGACQLIGADDQEAPG
jgi:MerR family transcriptional regulator, copper efflux regulator